MKKWNELSMRERAAIIKVGVANGITNLKEIRNKFEEGGPKETLGVVKDDVPESSTPPLVQPSNIDSKLWERYLFANKINPGLSLQSFIERDKKYSEEAKSWLQQRLKEDKDYSDGYQHSDVELVMEALHDQANSLRGININEASAKQEQEAKDNWAPYKLGIKAGTTAAELFAGTYFLTKGALKGTNAVARRLSRTTSRHGHPVYSTSSPAGKVREATDKLLTKMDKGQTTMSTLGFGADISQLMQGDTSWVNNAELVGDAAGIIGGTNIIRSTPWFGRYRNAIDTTLDAMGYTAAGYDVWNYLFGE